MGRRKQPLREVVHIEYDYRDVENPLAESSLGHDFHHGVINVLRGERFKYVHFAGLPPLLFDLQEDPNEFRNLADDPTHQDVRMSCAEELLTWQMAHNDRTLLRFKATPEGMISRF